jgi:hypothetical protein
MFLGALHHLDEFSQETIELQNFVTMASFWYWTVTMVLLLLWFLLALILNTQTRIFIKKEAKNRRDVMCGDRTPLKQNGSWSRRDSNPKNEVFEPPQTFLDVPSRFSPSTIQKFEDPESVDKKRVRNVFV